MDLQASFFTSKFQGDLQTADHEKMEVWSKKRQAFETRDIVWVATGQRRYKKKEEEESRSVQRSHQTQSGADSVAANAFKRMQSFVSFSGKAAGISCAFVINSQL